MTFLSLLFVLVSCGGLLLSGREKESYELLDKTKETCAKTLDHEVAAQTKCFPLLAGKEIVVQITRINLTPATQGVTLISRVGGMFTVYCELTKDQTAKLMQDPDLIKVGLRYSVKGKFTRYTQYGQHGAFTISECEAAGPVSVE